jgi:hypothetical protein
VFHSELSLPDAGKQSMEHSDLHDLKLYLVSCARMGSDLEDFTLSINGVPQPAVAEKLRLEVVHHLLRQR